MGLYGDGDWPLVHCRHLGGGNLRAPPPGAAGPRRASDPGDVPRQARGMYRRGRRGGRSDMAAPIAAPWPGNAHDRRPRILGGLRHWGPGRGRAAASAPGGGHRCGRSIAAHGSSATWWPLAADWPSWTASWRPLASCRRCGRGAVYSGIVFAAFDLFFSIPMVWSAAFGLLLVLALVWAPMRWLGRQ